MCTVILIEEKGNPKVAEKDIEVYKVCIIDVKGNILSYFEQFKYIPNKLYKARFSFTNFRRVFDRIENNYTLSLPRVRRTFVEHGYHSVLNASRLNSFILGSEEIAIKKFIVPKGAKYYENAVGNIVSNQIILRKS